jgi:cation-transporting ATPase 13A3/4/5
MFNTTGWVLDESVKLSNSELESDVVVLAYVRPQNASNGLEFASYEEGHCSQDVAIVRRFDFESKLARMSVIVKNIGANRFWSFVKGSPENIKNLCKESSVPANFDQLLNEYTRKGHRVIAFGARELDSNISYLDCQGRERDYFEADLQFLGLLVLENKLKEATLPTIETLNECNVRTIMATGDNTLTAVSVGRNCGML